MIYAEVYRLKGKLHRLKIHTDEPLSSYQLFLHNQLLYEGNTLEAEFDYQGGLPVCFQLKFSNGETIHCGYRLLPLAGMYNFRDLGGYPVKDGRHIRWGKLYRGDHLYNLKPEGIADLDALQLHSIVDFRGEKECEEYPNQCGHGAIVQYHYTPEGRIAAYAGALQNKETSNAFMSVDEVRELLKVDTDAGIKAMIQQQEQFVSQPQSQKAFADFLKLLCKETAAPLYFHCKGGKDRTGFAAMLLLSLLGVDEALIMEDYLLTNLARKEKNQRYLNNFRKMADGDEQVAQYFYALFDAKTVYLQAAINKIKSEYGDICHYAECELGIDETMIQTLADLYLE